MEKTRKNVNTEDGFDNLYPRTHQFIKKSKYNSELKSILNVKSNVGSTLEGSEFGSASKMV